MEQKISKHTTAAGRDIYSFSVQAFPGLVGNIYLIDDGGRLLMVDTGSGLEDSNQHLLDGVAALQEQFSPHLRLENVTAILITHGHIDHFGGLPFVRQYSSAPVGIHVLDRRVISNHEERLVMASWRLATFLEQAGVKPAIHTNMMTMYLYSKQMYQSLPTDFLLEEGQPVYDLEVIHVPGHCPGQVCLQVDDILLTADHILSRTSPHQAPESITQNMGLQHYLDSLAKIKRVPGIRLGLGGHEAPMADVYGRIDQICQEHDDRLNKLLEICREPRSVSQISRELFGKVSGYTILLALEEAGAHVEYLHQRGELVVSNLSAIENGETTVLEYTIA